MSFLRRVERWRSLAARVAPDLPVGLILAVIQRESGGVPGDVSRTGDYGLMQTKLVHLIGWNRAHPHNQITKENLRGTSRDDAEKQIKLGVGYLRTCLNTVHRWNPARWPWSNVAPPDKLQLDQLMYSDLCYKQGIAGTRRKRAAAIRAGYPDTFQGMERFAPGWGPGKPWAHARGVARLWASDTGRQPPPPSTLPRRRPLKQTFSAAPLLLLGSLFLAWLSAKK